MIDSASPRVRERRAQLGARARELAVERGLSGFTIDELCEDVGVSRRTFFNYFPTKEQAVLGRPEEGLEGEVLERFLAGGGAPGALSATLLDGLVDLAVGHFEGIGLTPDGAQQLFALLEREPKLFTALMQAGSERDRLLERFSAEREGVAPDDPRIRLAVQLVGTLARHAVEESFARSDGPPFEALLRERLRLARTLLTPDPEKDR
ncbi:helix-turn-helix domain-containing protein [Rathayibacter oskolensis]|uniref:TetR/AcrR family transcriptional regulator n=1 Tax=Rathayibacter oskolensis TaxID=1891671 RepID=UPI00265DEE10|nr:helix-turn-helix domain-containing protein [Rathayibacter oskolensis]WKK70517.1 helix-turn-helix domain-containing protein [Rathayibacter oskolensis]